MAQTPRLKLPFPLGTDPVAQGAGNIANLAAAVESVYRIWEYDGPATFNASGAWAFTHNLGGVPPTVTASAVAGAAPLFFTPGSMSVTAGNLRAWQLVGGAWVAYVGPVTTIHVIAVSVQIP